MTKCHFYWIGNNFDKRNSKQLKGHKMEFNQFTIKSQEAVKKADTEIIEGTKSNWKMTKNHK